MGVTGLWKLLDGTGTPVTIESLEGEVLAVDVSIWMNMAIKGMRNSDGCVTGNAHLISLFNRICKLLYFGVKPVFVFDGSTPALKTRVLGDRRMQRKLNSEKGRNAAEMLLKNSLKRHLYEQVQIGNKKNKIQEKKLKEKISRKKKYR